MSMQVAARTDRRALSDEPTGRPDLLQAETMPDLVIRFDAHQRCVYANLAAELASIRMPMALSGWQPGLEPALFEAEDHVLCHVLEEVLQTGAMVETEMNGLASGCGKRCYLVRIMPDLPAGGALLMARDVTELRKSSDEVQRARSRLRQMVMQHDLEQQENSRRLAHAVHEELGQSLAALRLQLACLGGLRPFTPAAVGGRVADMMQTLDQAIGLMREIAVSLHPVVLDAGLLTALRWLAGQFVQQHHMTCETRFPDKEPGFPAPVCGVVYQIVEQLFDNIAQHAAASHVLLELVPCLEGWRFRFEDNGRGFDMFAASADSSGHGLPWAQEQVAALGGEFVILSLPGKGTVIEIWLPGVRKF